MKNRSSLRRSGSLNPARIKLVLTEQIGPRTRAGKFQLVGYHAGQRCSRIIVGRDDSLNALLPAAFQNGINFLFWISDKNLGRPFISSQILQAQAGVIMMQKHVPILECRKLAMIAVCGTNANYFAHLASNALSPTCTPRRRSSSFANQGMLQDAMAGLVRQGSQFAVFQCEREAA